MDIGIKKIMYAEYWKWIKKSRMFNIRDLVQETGLEPTQAFARYHLKVVRLPIPPLLRD